MKSPRQNLEQLGDNVIGQTQPLPIYETIGASRFLDHLLNELRDRLVNSEERFLAQLLIPHNLNNLKRENQLRIYRAYEPDLQPENQFLLEIQRWVARWEMFPSKKPEQLCETLEMTNKELYPNVYCILKILLTMPPTTLKIIQRNETCQNLFKIYNGTRTVIFSSIVAHSF